MMDKKTFVSQFGAPTALVFKGQCYDAGEAASNQCDICGLGMRYVFILKRLQQASIMKRPEQTGKLHISTCCFHYFKRWNPELHHALWNGAGWLDDTLTAKERDSKDYTARRSVQYHVREWNRAKREARAKIRAFREKTGERKWLPADLFHLQEEIAQSPRPYKRVAPAILWLQQHTAAIRHHLEQSQ